MSLLKKALKKIGVSLLRILAGVPIVCLLGFGLLFLVLGATLKGRSVGLSAVILGGILYCAVGYWNQQWFKRIRVYLYACLLPLALLLYFVPMIFAPSGGKVDARVRNCFLHGQGSFSRYSPWNVIPEVDQLKVGMCLLPLGDQYTDFAKAARMRSLVLPLYEEMDKDPDFHSLGSVMDMAYADLFRLEFRTGHYYLFLPETTPGQRLPCLVFLHGMGGNIKSCLWVLSKLSRQAKCAVIAPTFGFGNWDRPGTAEFVVDVVREAIATLPLDSEEVYLMGYSCGGMGVTRAAIKEPGLFRGLIYLSAITEDESFSTEQLPKQTRDRKILFLHGGSDERIPLSLIESAAASLKRSGGNVRLKTYDGEDHYLLFSQPNAVLDDIRELMTAE
jgi:predicted esterase